MTWEVHRVISLINPQRPRERVAGGRGVQAGPLTGGRFRSIQGRETPAECAFPR